MNTHHAPDWTYVGSRSLEGVGVFYGRFAGPLLEPYLPDHFVIWQLLHGGNDQWYRGRVHDVQPGIAQAMQPGELVRAVRRHSEATEDVSVHLPNEEFLRAASAALGREVGAYELRRFQFKAAGVDRAARVVAGAVLRDADRLEVQEGIADLVGRLVVEDGTAAPTPVRRDVARCRAVRDYLEARLADRIGLDELEAEFGVTRYHLVRAFKSVYGVPPHQYLTHLRVTRARTLLQRGFPLSQIAVEVGFSDQSHLYRHFKRMVGMPPGEFIRRLNRRDRIQLPETP